MTATGFRARRTTRRLGLIAVAGLIAFAGPALAETKLLFNVFIPRAHHAFTEVIEPWGRQVETATQGRVKVEFSATSLAPIPRQFDMVKTGIADVGMDQTIFNTNRFELVKIVEFPFSSDSTEAASVAMWRTYEQHFAKANEYDGVKVLGMFTTGASNLWTSKVAVRKIDDAKGLKIRMSGVYVREIAQALGVAPIAEPGPKAYELVSNGVVDGSAFGMIDILNFKLANQLRHVLVVPGGLYSAGFSLIMNKAKWDALSKADQEAVMSVSGEAFARLSGKAWDRAEARARSELQTAGVQETQLSATDLAELKQRLAPVEVTWLSNAQKKGVDGKAALDYFRAQVSAVEKGR